LAVPYGKPKEAKDTTQNWIEEAFKKSSLEHPNPPVNLPA
jgi:hypothetical protein